MCNKIYYSSDFDLLKATLINLKIRHVVLVTMDAEQGIFNKVYKGIILN